MDVTDKENLVQTTARPRRRKYIFGVFFILLLSVLILIAFKFIPLTHQFLTQGISSSITKNYLGLTKLKGEEEGRVNILVLGIGVEGQMGADLTDTIMVASFDLKQNKATLISVPRDLYLKIPEIGYQKINAAYTLGNKESYPGGGGQLMEKLVGGVLGIPLDYYVVVDFEAFKKIINIIGGIDVHVEKDIYDYEYPSSNERGYEPFILKKGDYHMDGELALKYVRSRKSTSDFDRARRQQQVIMAIKEKILSLKILTEPQKVVEIYNALNEHIKTNLQPSELLRAVDLAKRTSLENVNNVVLDDKNFLYSDHLDGMYVLRPYRKDFSDIHKFVNFMLYQAPDIQKEKARIEIQNGTWTTGLAQEVAHFLKDIYGLNIVKITTADRADYNYCLIYDNTEGGKKATSKFLSEYFESQIIRQKKSSSDEADIVVILGRSFANKQMSE